MKVKVHIHFKFAHLLKAFHCSVRWMCNSTPHESTKCEGQIASGARGNGYSCWTAASAPNRIKVRVIRVDRRQARWCVHSEDSVAFCRSIGVGLDREGSIVSTCTEHHEFWRCHIPHPLISDIFLHQLAQACPHNVLHFLVTFLDSYGDCVTVIKWLIRSFTILKTPITLNLEPTSRNF